MKFRKLFIVIFHITGWILLYLLPPLITQSEIKLPQNFGDLLNWLLVIAFFYVNYLWLVPNYLSKSRFLIYFLTIFLMLSTCYFAAVTYASHRYKMEALEHSRDNRQQAEQHHRPPRFKGYFSALFCLTILALSTSIRVTEGWYSNEKQKKEMENQKLGAELSLLKSQINPHFFFNTLNSIYSLAIIKSDRTPEAVLKLSELMRYIIYDTERKLVPLSKEVEYIANYIELQRLRLPDDVKVKLKTDLGDADAVIEPLLLLPFVENAFKHGVDVEKGGIILIDIRLAGNELTLHVVNPLVEDANNILDKHKGIGVKNTLQRLNLLYQDNFTFSAGPVKKNYVVDLVVKIKENEVSDS
jgi:two-component system, LytTR family, sensor kinase